MLEKQILGSIQNSGKSVSCQNGSNIEIKRDRYSLNSNSFTLDFKIERIMLYNERTKYTYWQTEAWNCEYCDVNGRRG